MSMLIKNAQIITMNDDQLIISRGYLRMEGNLISEIGSGDAPSGPFERVIEGQGRVVLPGFINTHNHAAMTLLRGYADDLPLMEWLQTKIWPLEDRLTGEDIYWGSMLAVTEMIKSGTTTFSDMYFFMEETARAVEKTGIRAVLSRGMVGVGPENEKAMVESADLVQHWQGQAGGRILTRLGPHAPYTCPPDYLRRVMRLADELGVGLHIHIAETQVEKSDILAQYGKTPVRHLESLGLFSRPVLAAHCVHVDAEEIRILKDYGVGVAHNPESNMKLASGIAPVPEMLAAGIPVALGTDGASSNNNLDMLQEMRSSAFLHKVNKMDPTVLPAYQALEMATCNGARALGLDREIGSLEVGKKADMILLNLNQAHLLPAYDLVANLVYSAAAGDVETVIIDGQLVMEDRIIKTFDEQEVLRAAVQTARGLVGSR